MGCLLSQLCKLEDIMKTNKGLFLIALLTVIAIQACGPSEEELQQREQARLDSLDRVRVEQMEQARMDSLATVQRQQEEEAREAAELRNISYVSDGAFSVQVGSWRSETKAEEHVSMWKSRGFENAYSVKFGDESSGNVWFRVRMGNVASIGEAEKLMLVLMEDHQTESWIDNVR